MRNASLSIKPLLLLLIVLAVLTACSSGNESAGETAATTPPATATSSPTETSTAAPTEELKPVELIWYYPGPDIPADLQAVEDAVNKITQAKIKATIKLKPAAFGDYTQKMNIVVSAGEKADIIWTSSWLFEYAQNQGKGAFIELDALIDQYAPETKASLPGFLLDAARIGGKIYAVPNYQTITGREGFVIQKRYADKYKLDVNSIKQLEDIEPFLEQIKQGEPDAVPFILDHNGFFAGMTMSLGYEWLANPISVSLDNPGKVLNSFDSPYYKRYTDLMRSWYTKGYINKDAATLKQRGDLLKTGQAAVLFIDSMNAGTEVAQKGQNDGNDVILVPITPFFTQTSYVIGTMQAISRTSENPERAMMFINLLNTDQELFNTIAYGIEGKHYEKVADNIVKVNKEAGYAPNAAWVFGNIFNGYLQEGQDPGVFAQNKADNESATASPLMGFTFMPAAVTAEISNITAVIDQYGPGLNTGTIDPNEKLPEFLDKLKSAGIDKVMEEAQKQLDAFNAAK